MSQRYLGASYAVLHGPSAPESLCVFALENGFAGIQPGPAPRPVDWSAVRDAARNMPFGLAEAWPVAAPTVVEDRPDRGLANPQEKIRAVSIDQVRRSAATALRLGLPRLVLEPGRLPIAAAGEAIDVVAPGPGWNDDLAAAWRSRRAARRDAALDAACRTLHALAAALPDLTLCLTPGRTLDALSEPATLDAIFEDLGGRRLAYWHHAGLAAAWQERLGIPQGAWLEAFCDRIAGITLDDFAEAKIGMPPGSGSVDHPLVASYAHSRAAAPIVVVDLDPELPRAELPGVHSFLDRCGF